MKKSRMLDRYFRTAVIKRGYSRTANPSSENDDDKTTHFGFQTIKESEKMNEGKSYFH